MTKLSMSGGLLLLEGAASSLATFNIGLDHTQLAVAVGCIVLGALPASLHLASELFDALTDATHQLGSQRDRPYP